MGTSMISEPLRPTFKLLSDTFLDKIVEEAYQLLAKHGVYVENQQASTIFLDGGGRQDPASKRILLPLDVVQRALATAPRTFSMFDTDGTTSHQIGGDLVHFDPGSAALKIFDYQAQSERKPVTADLVSFHRIIQRLENFHFQSSGLISSDVPDEIADVYRMFVGFQHCSKPMVTGMFLAESFEPMFEILSAIRGSSKQLRERPLAIFDACPSPPLKWSNLTAQSVIDCARAGIPSEFVSMPLTGATSPVTIAGALVQLTAENLSGVVLAQLTSPGSPVVFGGSPASFDMRTANAPMGAMETMMIDSAYSQIGKSLGLPTHAYMGLSDSKCIDTQAGMETGMGAVLAALAGINVVSGGGMMDYESTQSLEKLAIDDEICGMAYRLIQGIAQRDEPIALNLFDDLDPETGFFTHPHTMQWFQVEHVYPKLMDRGNAQQWEEAGKPTLADRASKQVKELLATEDDVLISKELGSELTRIMSSYGKRFGIEKHPADM
jgi:trimethylamine--corrinoid protein Co-methyltransferase